MKLHDNAKYLELALRALDQGVLPDVKSETAKENLSLVRAILLELYKREGPGIELLQKYIYDGEVLCSEIEDVLGGNEIPQVALNDEFSGQPNFDVLADKYEKLIRHLDGLCVQMSSSHNKALSTPVLLRRAAVWEHAYFQELQQMNGYPSKTSPSGGNDSKEDSAPASELTRELLETFLGSRHGPVKVDSFTAVPGGYSNLTYFAGIRVSGGQKEEIVVRKSIAVVQAPFLDLEQEFSLLTALQKTGFPCPHPLDLGLHVDGIDDTFYTMDRFPGRSPGTYFHAEKPPSETMLLELAGILARLHRVPRETFTEFATRFMDKGVLSETVHDCYVRNLASLRQYVGKVEHLPSPYITWLFDWLERNIPKDTRPSVLTHGDFNVHNVIVTDDDHVTGVVDWETADFGAPEQDLSSFQPHVSKHMDWQRFLDHYHASGPNRIKPELMPFCLAYSMLRLTLCVSRKVFDLQHHLLDDPRYVQIQFLHIPGLMELGLMSTATGWDAASA